jgi:hypothetical protein
MAWTAPRTWVDGEVPTAALMNLHVRDNELVLKTPLGSDGRIVALDSTRVASLSGTNLTGLVFLTGASHTVGVQRFLDPARVILPVGADKWTGTKGVNAAGVWIEGDYLHHIAQDVTTEWRFLGVPVGTPAGATVGSFWVEDAFPHYIDASGVERYIISNLTQHSDAAAVGGSGWVESYVHWIRQSGTLEYVGHYDVLHADGTTHSDHSDHSDSGAHDDSSVHTDTGSPHDDNPGFHVDHTDGPGHADIDPVHTDHTDHTDHDDHSDSGPHSDSNPHDDHTDHGDVTADSRPVVV